MANLQLDWYIGRKVIAVTRGEKPWEWGIKIQGNVEFRNKDMNEVFRPMDVVNSTLKTIAHSMYDTTFIFMRDNKLEKISFQPSKYVVFDPKYGSEIYPQWPEELDAMGITANEGKAPPNPEPSKEWGPEKARLNMVRAERISENARRFFEEETEKP